LKETDFESANLVNADLGRDNLNGATQVQGANFSGANLQGVKYEGALYDDRTVFPVGFQPDLLGMCRVK
jgi:uncharacterized protein YjbI with pentapeptide repeats